MNSVLMQDTDSSVDAPRIQSGIRSASTFETVRSGGKWVFVRNILWALVALVMIASPVESQEYVLGSGDQVKVTVFGEDDLSGEFQLDGESKFSMPLIGTVSAAKATQRNLEERIATMLKDGFLKNPRVSVEVLNYRPFYILGEVNKPGSYPYRAGMTILNAAALAGGFTFRADEDDIEVTRGGKGEPKVLSPETIVQPGDVIRVKESIF